MTSDVVAVSSIDRGGLELDVLEHLDVGVIVADRGSATVLFANGAASEPLAALGADGGSSVPARLIDILTSQLLPEVDAVPTRFSPAMPVQSPDGRKFYVRARAMDRPAGAVLLVVVLATVREKEIRRVLTAQFGLSLQEIRVASLACQGYRNKEIAERLRIVEGTVKNYLTRVFEALSVHSRTELAAELSQLSEEYTESHRRRV